MSRIRALLETGAGRAVVVGAAVAVIGVATFAVVSVLRPPPAATEPSATVFASASPPGTPSASPPPASTAFTVEEGIVQVIADGVAMQASPSADADTVAQLSKGQVVWATGAGSKFAESTWVEVRQEPSERVGWVPLAAADGQPSLAVVRDGPIGVTSGVDVELIDLSTAERTALTSGMRVHDLAFAPNGEQVALIDPVNGPRVVALNEVTSPEPTTAPGGPTFGPPAMKYPAFAPNGDAVAYLEGQDFLGLSLLWLGDGPAPSFATPATLFPASWSPDSHRLASAQAVSTGDEEHWAIVVADEGAAEPTRLTPQGNFSVSPAWSPDGSTIAYLQDLGGGTTGLAVMDPDGGNAGTLLTFDGFARSVAEPAWSPDGSQIAIAQYIAGQSAVIYLVDAQTSEHHSIPAPADECSDLTWSPSGSHIAYVCSTDGVDMNAYVTPTDGANVMTLGEAWHVDWARTLEPLSVP